MMQAISLLVLSINTGKISSALRDQNESTVQLQTVWNF